MDDAEPPAKHAIADGPEMSRRCKVALTALLCGVTLGNADWRLLSHQGLDVLAGANAQSLPANDKTRPQSEEVELPTPPVLLLAQVVEMERLLSKLGFEPGKADGLIDSKTRAAISTFQELAELAVDGEPSRELLEALREIAGYQSDGG